MTSQSLKQEERFIRRKRVALSFIAMSLSYFLGIFITGLVEYHFKTSGPDEFLITMYVYAAPIFTFLIWLVLTLPFAWRMSINHPLLQKKRVFLSISLHSFILFMVIIGWAFFLEDNGHFILVPAACSVFTGLIFRYGLYSIELDAWFKNGASMFWTAISVPGLLFLLHFQVFPKISPDKAYHFLPYLMREEVLAELLMDMDRRKPYSEFLDAHPAIKKRIVSNTDNTYYYNYKNQTIGFRVEYDRIVWMERTTN